MKIAYLILAHHKPQQLFRLLKHLDGNVFVHVDRRADLSRFQNRQSNVELVTKRASGDWGGFGIVEATLNLMRCALETHSDRFVLLSGADYPIKPVSDFYDFLSARPDQEFLNAADLLQEWPGAEIRYAHAYFENPSLNKAVRKFKKLTKVPLPKVQLPLNVRMYGGSQWWCLSRPAVDAVVRFFDRESTLSQLFSRMLLPDEHFVQTILMNSRLKERVMNNNLRFIDFVGAHPRVLQTNDYDMLIKQEAMFWARKFDDSVDSEVLDRLDEFCGVSNKIRVA